MFETILVPVDLGEAETAKPAIAKAVEIASGNPDSRIRLIYVRPIVPVTYMEFMPPAFDEEQQADAEKRLAELAAERIDLPMTIGAEHRLGGGERFDVVQPHRHAAVLGTAAQATASSASACVAWAAVPRTAACRCGWTTSKRSPLPIRCFSPSVMVSSIRSPASSARRCCNAARSGVPGA